MKCLIKANQKCSVRIDVDALLAEKARIEEEEKAGIRRPQVEPRQAALRPCLPPQAYVAPSAQRPRKRKLQELQSHLSNYQSSLDGFEPPYHANPKKSNEVPPTKRLHGEVDVRALPCCLCASPTEAGLLPVNDPPFPHMGLPIPKSVDGTVVWRAHEICAMTIPETWVDEIGGERRVFGVDAIIKDRWNLVSFLILMTPSSLLNHNSAARLVLQTSTKSMALQFSVRRGNALKRCTSPALCREKATRLSALWTCRKRRYSSPSMPPPLPLFPVHQQPNLRARWTLHLWSLSIVQP